VQGDGPAPSLVLSLVQRLPDDSLTHALLKGGHEHLGWGLDRHLQASIFDAIQINTRATGNFKKPPKFEPWPRPKSKAKGKKRVSVRDVFAKFQNLRR